MAEKLLNCKAGSILQDTIGLCLHDKILTEEEVRNKLRDLLVSVRCSLKENPEYSFFVFLLQIVSVLTLYRLYIGQFDAFSLQAAGSALLYWLIVLYQAVYVTRKFRINMLITFFGTIIANAVVTLFLLFAVSVFF